MWEKEERHFIRDGKSRKKRLVHVVKIEGKILIMNK